MNISRADDIQGIIVKDQIDRYVVDCPLCKLEQIVDIRLSRRHEDIMCSICDYAFTAKM